MNTSVANETAITTSPIVEYSRTEAAMAGLKERYGGLLFNVSTATGLAMAKQARSEIRGYRTSLEKMRVDLKAPILERGKLLDDEAKRITALLVALEEPIDAEIKKEESRKAAEKAEREAMERARVAAIVAKIEAIKAIPGRVASMGSGMLALELETLEEMPIDDSFKEFFGEADAAKSQTVARMQEMLVARQALEAEAERVKQERKAQKKAEDAELHRRVMEFEQRAAEQAARDRIVDAAHAAEAERQRVANEAALAAVAAEREALAMERAALDMQRLALQVADAVAETSDSAAFSDGPRVSEPTLDDGSGIVTVIEVGTTEPTAKQAEYLAERALSPSEIILLIYDVASDDHLNDRDARTQIAAIAYNAIYAS